MTVKCLKSVFRNLNLVLIWGWIRSQIGSLSMFLCVTGNLFLVWITTSAKVWLTGRQCDSVRSRAGEGTPIFRNKPLASLLNARSASTLTTWPHPTNYYIYIYYILRTQAWVNGSSPQTSRVSGLPFSRTTLAMASCLVLRALPFVAPDMRALQQWSLSDYNVQVARAAVGSGFAGCWHIGTSYASFDATTLLHYLVACFAVMLLFFFLVSCSFAFVPSFFAFLCFCLFTCWLAWLFSEVYVEYSNFQWKHISWDHQPAVETAPWSLSDSKNQGGDVFPFFPMLKEANCQVRQTIKLSTF